MNKLQFHLPTAPSSNGGAAITSYTATSSPGGFTGTVTQSGDGTITVSGLTNGTGYTFTVTATNAIGTSVASAASSSVVPIYPPGSLGALLSESQKNTINATNSLKAIGLTDWSELIGFTDNGGSLYAEGYYLTDSYTISQTKTYLMFSENSNWDSSTKVFLAEYIYNANSYSDLIFFSDGSAAAKTENVTISSNQKYIQYINSGTNYTVNITIAKRTQPLYLDLENSSNARGNRVNITFADPSDAGLVFYNYGGGNYATQVNGSTIQFSTYTITPALAYIDEVLASGSPSRVLWFSGDMILTLYDYCGYPYTANFDPDHPIAPQFNSKTINGHTTFVSDITDGYESQLAKFMNCNTIYQSVPY
jgi:hypothetical protein